MSLRSVWLRQPGIPEICPGGGEAQCYGIPLRKIQSCLLDSMEKTVISWHNFTKCLNNLIYWPRLKYKHSTVDCQVTLLWGAATFHLILCQLIKFLAVLTLLISNLEQEIYADCYAILTVDVNLTQITCFGGAWCIASCWVVWIMTFNILSHHLGNFLIEDILATNPCTIFCKWETWHQAYGFRLPCFGSMSCTLRQIWQWWSNLSSSVKYGHFLM